MFGVSKFILEYLARLLAVASFFLHIRWVNFHNRVFSVTKIISGPHPDMVSLVAVIGDDAVAGVGDWVVFGAMPSFVRHLQAAINKCPNVRRVWTCGKYGVPNTTSADWSPRSTTPHKTARNIFEFCFGPTGDLRLAPVVCVMVGTNDTGEPSGTLANLTELAAALRALGKVVIIATAAPPHRPMPLLTDRASKRNTLLREYARTEVGSTTMVLGPALDQGLNQMANHYRFNGQYSGTGHKRLGNMWAAVVTTEVTKIEWKWFQVLLGSEKP